MTTEETDGLPMQGSANQRRGHQRRGESKRKGNCLSRKREDSRGCPRRGRRGGSQEVTAGVGLTSRAGSTGRWGDSARGRVTAHPGKE